MIFDKKVNDSEKHFKIISLKKRQIVFTLWSIKSSCNRAYYFKGIIFEIQKNTLKKIT